jgi:hypothetical protein
MFKFLADGLKDLLAAGKEATPSGRQVSHTVTEMFGNINGSGIWLYCQGGQRYLVVVDNCHKAVVPHSGVIDMQEKEWITVSNRGFMTGVHRLDIDGCSYVVTINYDSMSVQVIK